MNCGMVARSLGWLLLIEAGCMAPSFLVALIFNQGDAYAFAFSIFITAAAGLAAMSFKPATTDIFIREGFAIVGLGWLLVSAFGAIPFVMSGAIPSAADAFFESVSGFTTTGSSILKDVESLPRGVVFWRSFTHWVGGMGVLALVIAILPLANANTFHIMQAESSGPSTDKFVPRMGRVVRILYSIYILLTLIQLILLLLGGMSLYDSLIHSFGTAGTGGFSDKNASVAAFGSVYIETVITVFMFIFGVNFTIYYAIFRGDWRSALRDEELRFFCALTVISVALIVWNTKGQVFQSWMETFRYAAFQVCSIITTTGFSTADFNKWPAFSQFILLLLMLVGASAGSTSGALKCVRVVLLSKLAAREFVRLLHPDSVKVIKLNGRAVDEGMLSGVAIFFFLYIAILIAAALMILLDGKDLLSSFTAVLSCIGNIGPGIGIVGPMGNFAGFSPAAKVVLSLCMVMGRLEIYPILLLAAPLFRGRKKV
jgi:trk system potassium uptake protein TrkH